MDLILHPLKSELNWPLGHKEPLDFTRSNQLGNGLRWKIPFYLLDAVLSFSVGRTVADVTYSQVLWLGSSLPRLLTTSNGSQRLPTAPYDYKRTLLLASNGSH